MNIQLKTKRKIDRTIENVLEKDSELDFNLRGWCMCSLNQFFLWEIDYHQAYFYTVV